MRTRALAAALLVLGLGAAGAGAEEVKTAVGASMLLRALAAPSERRVSAFDESLKAPGPAAARGSGEVLRDGSVRYGDGPGAVVVTVKNPCPPGTAHGEPPPLPGRRARD